MLRESILADAIHARGNADRIVTRPEDEIESALRAVRMHLGMDIGFVSEFLGTERVFHYVDSNLPEPPLRRGDRLSMDAGYCRKVVSGELPEIIADTSLIPAALAIPETSLLPIGSHMSVPIRLSDGSVYGTFCCFSSIPDTSLRIRDLQTMRAVADLVASHIEGKIFANREQERLKSRVQAALAGGEPAIVYQPIIRLSDMTVVGAEALARFESSPPRGPDKWFQDADTAGLRTELEIAALQNALRGYRDFWQKDWYLTLNISPKTVVDCNLAAVLEGYPLDKIVLELTEHEHVEDYDALASRLADLRAAGLRIAVDDAGSGYASLRHVLNIRPDIIKLDISLTHEIDLDPVRQALGAAIVNFGRRVRCNVVAEGIETETQLAALRDLGINLGQGYLFSRPVPVSDLEHAISKA